MIQQGTKDTKKQQDIDLLSSLGQPGEQMNQLHGFWDFTVFIPGILKEKGNRLRDVFSNQWEKKNWRNVPGPFYTSETDTCLTGRMQAAENVLYDENGEEFIFRQPRDRQELVQVVAAAYFDPFTGYGCDGNDRWVSHSVREWWRGRQDLLNWIVEQLRNPESQSRTHENFIEQNQVEALRDFEQYFATGLHDYLRAYVFFLEERRVPQESDPLPWL